MSIKELATELQAHGRGNDSVLVHMSPTEVNSLRELAQATGGDLTINPETGLMEAGWLESILPIVAGAAAMFIPGLQGVGATLIAGAMAGGATAMALGGGPDEVAGGMMGGASGASMAGGLGIGAGGAESVTAGMGAEAAATGAGSGAEYAMVDVLGDGMYASQGASWAGDAAMVDVLGDGVYGSYGAEGYGAAADMGTIDVLGDGIYGAESYNAVPDMGMADLGTVDVMGDGMYGANADAFNAQDALMQDTYGITEGMEVPGDVMRTPGTSDPFVDTLGQAKAPGKQLTTQQQIRKYYDKVKKGYNAAQKAGLLGPDGEPKKQQMRPMGAAPAYNPPDMLDAPNVSGGGFQPTWRQGSTNVPIPGSRSYADGGIMDGMASGAFIVPADVVSAAGNGSTDAGLRQLAALGAKPIRGPGDGLSDDIQTNIDGAQPARVADGEAYIAPEIVARIGGGDHSQGAKRLYEMLDRIRDQAHGKTQQQRPVDLREAL